MNLGAHMWSRVIPVASNDTFKLSALPARCPADKQGHNSTFRRAWLEWPCHPGFPTFFQLRASLLESSIFLGRAAQQAALHISCSRLSNGACQSVTRIYWAFCGETDLPMRLYGSCLSGISSMQNL